MVKSMTGYGKGEGGGFVVEMRSVNHKYLDLSFKLPRPLMPLEGTLKKAVSDRFSRGRIEVFVYRSGREEAPKKLRLDMEAARQYLDILNELKADFSLPGEVDLGMLASFGNIVSEEEESEDLEKTMAAIMAPLGACMDSLENMRADEGRALAEDILSRAGTVSGALDEVEKRAPTVVAEYAGKLKERIAKLVEGVELDKDRLHVEVAIYADRGDITEELVRGRSHLRQLRDMLAAGGAIGRKLDFLLQELNREVNTIGSKATDKDIAYRVVEMKAELEKVREQVQNIE